MTKVRFFNEKGKGVWPSYYFTYGWSEIWTVGRTAKYTKEVVLSSIRNNFRIDNHIFRLYSLVLAFSY